MKHLRVLLIIAFIFLAAIIIIGYHYNHDKIPEFNPTDSQKPTRIVSLAPDLTEILFALGLNEKIVAVSSDSDYPHETATKNKVGTFWQPNTEAIIAAKPDLVITLWFEQQKAVADSLNRLGYQVLTLRIEKIEELFTAIQKIGDATGCKKRADELAKNIALQLNDLQAKFSSANKVRVLWVVQPEPLRVAGRNTFINELINLAGGENAIGSTIAQYPQIGTEEILTSDTAVIIHSAMGSDIDRQQQAAQAFWSKYPNLPAVKTNRIYVVDSDIVLRLGPRLPQGAEMIAGHLHPEIAGQNRNKTQ
jgi:iron complex transport system substrate-binding protein